MSPAKNPRPSTLQRKPPLAVVGSQIDQEEELFGQAFFHDVFGCIF